MVVNALLGTVLWASYAEASGVLQPHIRSHPTAMAAVAGALAGGTQALVSAPAENVRLLVEGGTSHNSWLHAWKEVFRGTPAPRSSSRHETIEEIRQVRSWMREVGDMAGRGWHGLRYTLGKDVTGFAAFFAIFDMTRRIALKVRSVTQDATRSVESTGGNSSKKKTSSATSTRGYARQWRSHRRTVVRSNWKAMGCCQTRCTFKPTHRSRISLPVGTRHPEDTARRFPLSISQSHCCEWRQPFYCKVETV